MEAVLIKSANNHDSPIHDCVKELYHNNLDFERLDLQLKMLPDVMKQEPKIREITKISTICQVLVGNPPIKKLFSEVDKLLKTISDCTCHISNIKENKRGPQDIKQLLEKHYDTATNEQCTNLPCHERENRQVEPHSDS